MKVRNTPTEQEFLAAYDSCATGIFRHCLLRVSSRPYAEEIAQETFLRTWEYIRSGEEIYNLKAFLYKTANNLITDHYRRNSASPEFSLDRLLDDGLEPPSPFDDLLRYETAELLKEVEGVLSGLKPEYREIILLRHIEELETEEIAEVLGISYSAVYVRLHRALKALRSRLDERGRAALEFEKKKLLKEPAVIRRPQDINSILKNEMA